ncbi:MAG: hypothetical protein KIT17_07010 [Rubrivivax sp.]|nr:hypothetical protein [Rubrivivax sp.]
MATEAHAVRQRLACPRCARPVHRRRRTAWQRWLTRHTALARFRCSDSACGWSGLLTRRLDPEAAPSAPPRTAAARRWRQRAMRGVVPLLLAGMALLAAWWGVQQQAPAADVRVGARFFAPGESYGGDPLGADHPLARLAGRAGTVAPEHARGLAAVPQTSPLALRRFCAWGGAGHKPYRGTLDEVLRLARLPAAVREQINVAHAAARPHDRVVVSRDAVRSGSGPRVFDPELVALAEGRQLCLGARVNFADGEADEANLFEAFDDHGRRHSVMVPDDTSYVALLRETGERRRPVGSSAGTRSGAAHQAARGGGLDGNVPHRTEGAGTVLVQAARPSAHTKAARNADTDGSDGAARATTLRLATRDALDPFVVLDPGPPGMPGARAEHLALAAHADGAGNGVHEVPAPGTLALVLPALAAMWAVTRRRRRAPPAGKA